MPVKGFRDLDGVAVPMESIDFITDAPRFNCSPASLAMLTDSVRARDGVAFSASQLGSTTRQHLLRESDYYPTTGQAMSGFMGTMRHQQINVQRDRLIVEQRFTSKRNPKLSAQIDSAAIVELTDDGTLVVDLYDLKTLGWFGAKLILQDVWKNKPDYAWQLNLGAALMEETDFLERADFSQWGASVAAKIRASEDPIRMIAAARIRVRNLYLEVIPSDASYKNARQAEALGAREWQKQIVPVSRKSADETYAVYEEAMRLRDQAIADGYAPICSERWKDDIRCKFFCDVRDECIQFAADCGEYHPLTTPPDELLTILLEQSIAQAQMRAAVMEESR